MLKTRKRWISLLVTLAMLVAFVVPFAGPAAAATTYGALTTPTVVPPATTNLGTILITIDTLGNGPHRAIFSLPADFDRGTPVASLVGPSGANITAQVEETTNYETNEFRLDVVAGAVYSDVKISVALNNVKVPSSASGDIVCTVTGLEGQLTSGSVVVGRASSGQVDLSTVDVPSITSAGTSGGKIQINIKENAIGGLKTDPETLKFTLPSGFEWTGTPTIIDVATGNSVSTDVYANIASDARKLIIKREGSGGKNFFRVKADIKVDETTAKFGDVVATVGGASSTNVSEITVAKYVDYGVTVTGKSVETILAGRTDQEIGDFYIEEAAPGSLINGRTVTLKLPANAKWVSNPVVEYEKGSNVLSNWTPVDSRTIKATVTGSSSASKILLKDAKVKLAVDTVGDLAIEVGGTAGATGSVVVARVVAPITVSAASTPDVKIGEQSQAAGDITIVESKKEAIDKAVYDDLVIEAPSGISFAVVPTVTVTDGDIQIDKVTKKGGTVIIEIKSTSSKASTIKVSDIKYTVDRTVPVGPIELNIKGDGVNKTAADFANATVAAKVVNANCVTPAPVDQKGTAVFKIGEKKYTVNGQEFEMDVAPIAEAGRTYLPARFVANAMGVPDANILWDQASKTVTVIRGERFVQMKVGSKQILVNGITLNMDVAPKVVPGRVLIPFRFLAQALGAEVVWDPADPNTIILNF